MRVCHVVRQYKPSVGGLENFVAHLARSLNELGVSNEVLTLDRTFADRGRRLPPFEVMDGVKVHRVAMLGHPRFFLPLIPKHFLGRFDVIHVHGVDGMFDRVARHAGRSGQVRAATSHGLFFHTPWMRPVKELYLNTATRLSARRYHLLIANSHSDMAKLHTVSDDIVHLPNGVSRLGEFRATGRDLLYLGRLARHKHIERVIAALAQPQLAGVQLHIVGPEWDVAQLRLAKLADEFGVSDQVRIYGALDKARLAAVAKQCAVFVSASSYEGFGMSLIEAMSIGLIPVVESNASFEELMARAPVGELTQFAYSASAATAIRRQIDMIDDERRSSAIEYSKRFSWEGHAERTLRLYLEARARSYGYA
jgi:alpha-1,3-mannosyltransferase